MKFTQERARRIIEGVRAGVRLTDICREVGVDRTQVWRWTVADQDFATQYARAREASADVVEEEIATLSSEVRRGEVPPDAARVMLNAMTWLAKVRAPKVYGDKQEVAMTGSVHVTINEADA